MAFRLLKRKWGWTCALSSASRASWARSEAAAARFSKARDRWTLETKV